MQTKKDEMVKMAAEEYAKGKKRFSLKAVDMAHKMMKK